MFGGSLAASAALLSVHKIGNQATHSRIAWLPEEHNLMGIVVFGEMPSRSFYGFFDMKLPKNVKTFSKLLASRPLVTLPWFEDPHDGPTKVS